MISEKEIIELGFDDSFGFGNINIHSFERLGVRYHLVYQKNLDNTINEINISKAGQEYIFKGHIKSKEDLVDVLNKLGLGI